MPNHKKILVVDDDPDILISTSRFLEQAGLQVFRAETGQEALTLAFCEQPALVLLDSGLPSIDGQGICRQIKENPLCQNTLVLMISASRTTTDDRTNAPDDGADGYLARPISNRELLSHIEAMLRIREHEIGLATRTQELEEAIRIRKVTEAALEQRLFALTQRAQELSALLNAVPAAVWIAHDPQALHISGNRQSYEWLGLPEGANVSKSSPEGEKPETFRLFKNGLELRTQEMPVQRSAAGEQLRDYEFDLVYTDGASRHLLGNATPLFDEQGKPRGSVSVFIDITERKQMEEKLLRAQRMESIGALAGGVAHDLNNILAPIMMSASLLQEELSPKMRKELLASIETAAHRGAHIVNQVLTFARGIKGIRTLVDPEITLLEMEKIAWETFPKSISVSVTLPEGLWNAIGDPTQLHQVLLNLCINARDAMPQGGTLVLSAENIEISRLQASLHPDAKPGRYIKFKITDSGRGIAPHNINKIFDPFFTTKGPCVGTGLGLSMVAGIVRSHGGFIIVASEVDKGTTFEVFIPASKEAAQASESPTASAPTSGKGELILVVDDEPEVLKLTKAILEQFGYSVLAAKDGREAVTLYAEQSSHIQLVITDLMMPKIDGAGVARVIRQSDQNLPIIVASGFGSDEIQNDLSTLGIQTFLKKPFNATHLLQTIHDTIHKKES